MGIEKKVQNEQVPDVQDNADYKGIVGRMAEAAKSRYGKLATGIATGLLAAGLYAANPGKAKAQEPAEASVTQEEGRRLPDLSDWTKLDGERYVDKSNDIPGKDTIQHCYKNGEGEMMIVSYFKADKDNKNLEQPYAFSIRFKNGKIVKYGDVDADASFEVKWEKGKEVDINENKYF